MTVCVYVCKYVCEITMQWVVTQYVLFRLAKNIVNSVFSFEFSMIVQLYVICVKFCHFNFLKHYRYNR